MAIAFSLDKPDNKTAHINASPLARYDGEWGFEQAAHLYRRTVYGARPKDIAEAADHGMELTVDQLLEDIELPTPPINYYYEGDPIVPVGETWADKPYTVDEPEIIQYRRRSLAAWTMENLITSGLHIREKMTLFWHNHFVTQASVLRDPNLIYYNIDLLRKGSLGNFRQLVKDVTINPAMLRYLNGNQNTNLAPNENYARELLELFTIGKGELAGPGDYTTFTEEDVLAIARILTGWRDTGYYSRDGQPLGSRFRLFFHDTGTKVLSHRFGTAEVSNMNDQEYIYLIDLIFQQEEVSRYICRKLYRWFVYYDIDDQIESQVIEPLAGILRDNDYEIQPVMKALLTSEHFYQLASVGPMIKNPIDFVVNLFIQFEVQFPDDLVFRYNILLRFLELFQAFQMNYYEPPNVAGWKAYYQEPLFYRTWITSATLPVRQQFTDLMSAGVMVGDFRLEIDILGYVEKFNDPFDPNALIEEFVQNLFPQPITENQHGALKEILIPGLPDFEWTVEYGAYVSDPGNPVKRQAVESKLRRFTAALLTMPEYYLS